MVTPDGTIPPSGNSQTTPAAWVLEFEEGKKKESPLFWPCDISHTDWRDV